MITFYVIKIHSIYRIKHEKDIHFSLIFKLHFFTVTGCEDKEAKATIEQTNTDNCTTNGRKYTIKSWKEKAEKVIPAIFAEKDPIFEK